MSDSEMKLPNDLRCSDCHLLARCVVFIKRTDLEDECDWYPIKFEPIEQVSLTELELKQLLEYSASLPSMTTIGKRWKAKITESVWWLGEFVEHANPKKVGILWKKILVIHSQPDFRQEN